MVMDRRTYRLGKRQAGAHRTREAILAAARDLMVADEGSTPSVVAVAHKAGVSRLTVYQHFGSKQSLIRALAGKALPSRTQPIANDPGDARDQLRRRIESACSGWAADPSLFRRLAAHATMDTDTVEEDRILVMRLATSDQLRPGCSLREAEDVIGTLTSFSTFDRLARDGRRSPSAVSEILMRLASAILVG